MTNLQDYSTEPNMKIEKPRIWLSPPHMSGLEARYIQDAFDSNWISSVGPNITEFELEVQELTGAEHAVALSSGTAAIHLGLRLHDVGAGDDVLSPSFTFCGSVNPIIYQGATPIFIDSERLSWNLDPNIVEGELMRRSRLGIAQPKAMIVVHIYGQSADMHALSQISAKYGVPIVEDAAEALGAFHGDSMLGTIADIGAYSFNGNKVITTSGGGMLVTSNSAFAERAKKLATQAREPAPHYEHVEIGYNYRMSNILAGIGRGQLKVLDDRVSRRRDIFQAYKARLESVPGLDFTPDAAWGRHSHWLSCLLINPTESNVKPSELITALSEENIEARMLWKPMHQQPVFKGSTVLGGGVAEDLFERGVCLPSGSNLEESDLERICFSIRRAMQVKNETKN